MFKKLAEKKKRSSSAELLPSSSKTYFDIQERAPIRVAKKEIPLSRDGTPALAMPKPKHATAPTQAVLVSYDHDKTEIEDGRVDTPEEEETQGPEEVIMAGEYVRALQHQVMMIQRQCVLERAEWQKREEEHRKREQEMMEAIYQTQDKLRLVAYQRQKDRMRQRPLSTAPIEMDKEQEWDGEDDEYLIWQPPKPKPLRSRRNSSSSFQEYNDPFPAYHYDLSDPFLAHGPIVRSNYRKPSTPHQYHYYRHQQRPSSSSSSSSSSPFYRGYAPV